MSSRRIALSALLLAPLCSACERASPGEPLTTPQYIVNGIIDANNTYSNVGAFIVKRLSDGQIFPICSGTLIAETVFLTAAHCTAAYLVELAPFGFAAYVTFDSPIGYGALTNDPGVTLNAVSQVVTNPAYNQRQSESGDIGVLILSRPARGTTPATLPTLGLLDKLAAAGALKNATFTAVGFGVQERVTGGGRPFHLDLNPTPRMYAFSSFNSLGPGYLRLSQNASTGNGGTCFGDSGGPNFLPMNGALVLVATTVGGDLVCRSTNVDYRLDTKSARAFLSNYVTLP
jgi:secreted trypsin-like serine protease